MANMSPAPGSVLSAERRGAAPPFFSICIPQHNRTAHLIEALKVLERQTLDSFEVCISDDCSTDGKQHLLVDYLQSTRMAFVFKPTEKNLRYDGNLRGAIGLAQGRYCILMGNDDCLAAHTTLETLQQVLTKEPRTGVLIGNFEDSTTGEITRRVHHSRVYPGTFHTAAAHYRNMAFVSGLVVDRQRAQELASLRWDGSEMYQMLILCGVIAGGMKLIETDVSLVRKDLRIPDEEVDSYAKRAKVSPCPIIERHLPFMKIGQVVVDAIEPYAPKNEEAARAGRELVFQQLYRFTYPYWLLEYRRVQSWNYSAGLCLGIRPRNVVRDIDVGLWGALRLRMLWLAICVVGMTIPLQLFERLKSHLYRLSKSFAS